MTTSIFGSVVDRVDAPVPRGVSGSVDDLRDQGALRARFVGSIIAHLGVRQVDPPLSPEHVRAARTHEGRRRRTQLPVGRVQRG